MRGDGRRIETGEALRTPGPGIAQTASGRVFVVDYGGTGIHEVFDDGRTSLFVDGLSSPVGLTVSPSGDLSRLGQWRRLSHQARVTSASR
ncbi:hypothetical protein [Rhizobium croatiense]|uniref:hypothetical protein n=1 Tax=Rhizobium croatiense TaxID=2867516 RepID=UPI001C9349C4|nr:hypothetical protein [Rhizobium croatiense]